MEEKSYVYEEDEYEEGLTFKKVGHFFKVGWLRMIIFAAIAAAVAAIVAIPVKQWVSSEPVAQMSVEYIYKGIEKGQDPNGGQFDTNEIISTSVLSKAVADSALGDKITDISKLRASMRVEAVLTEEYVKLMEAAANGDAAAQNTLRTYVMYPTRFNVILSEPGKLGLSDAQAVVLLGNIYKEYCVDFQKRYAVTSMFDETMYNLSASKTLEYTDIYDVYVQSLEPIRDYLTELQKKDATFTSVATGTTFSQLISRLNMISTNYYDRFNSYVLANNVWRDGETAKNQLLESRKDILDKKSTLSTYRVDLQKQIDSIQPNKMTSSVEGVTQTITYPAEYYTYQDKLDEANRQMMSYDNQLANIVRRLKTLGVEIVEVQKTDSNGNPMYSDAANTVPVMEETINILPASSVTEGADTEALSKLVEIEALSVKFVEDVNATIEDYYNTEVIPNSVRQPLQPLVTRKGLNFNILLVLAIAAAVGLIAGGIVTVVKISKASAAAKANESAPVEEKPEE